MTQPIQQRIAILCREYRLQRIAPLLTPLWNVSRREQVQIVIAQHRYRAPIKRVDQAQHAEAVGTAIDQIAGEPETIAGRVE